MEHPQRFCFQIVFDKFFNEPPSSAMVLILPEKYPQHTIFCMGAASYTVLLFASITAFIILIRKTLSKNAEHMSERTVQLHRTLLKSLIFQVSNILQEALESLGALTGLRLIGSLQSSIGLSILNNT
ncbi:hypothetical protein COOONC_17684 [Cooperia oncophora]